MAPLFKDCYPLGPHDMTARLALIPFANGTRRTVSFP